MRADVEALEWLLRKIEDTGDHPLTGLFCPGRHRVAWTVARVHVDACRPRECGRRSAHRSADPQLWRSVVLIDLDAAQLARKMRNALRRRAMYPVG